MNARPSIPLLTWKEDKIELAIAVCSFWLLLFLVQYEHQTAPTLLDLLLGAIAFCALIRIATEVMGRVRLNDVIRYQTGHGLIVVGDRVPPKELVEYETQKIIEWALERDVMSEEDAKGMFTGVVLEVIPTALEDCSLLCPWALLPWDSDKWLRVGLFEKTKTPPALRHVLFHRILVKARGLSNTEDAHEAMHDIGFDNT